MNPQSAKLMDLSTDYPLDKIVCLKTGSVSISANNFVDVIIPHGLYFTPLMDGTYSTISDFSLSYDIGSGEPYSGNPVGFFAIESSIYADDNNINLHITNYTSSSITVYYRLFGLMPSNVNEFAAFTNSLSNDFVFNTDFNYTKLFIAQRYTSTQTITHDLTYRPQISSWYELIGVGIYKTVYADLANPFAPTLVRIGTNDIGITITNASYAVHIRAYLDE